MVAILNYSKSIFYNQANQIIVEKTALVNSILNKYDTATENLIYHSTNDATIKYLETSKDNLTSEEAEIWNQYISKEITSDLTINNSEISSVYVFDKNNNMYTNNAVYSGTFATVNEYKAQLYPMARAVHGKMIVDSNSNKKNVISVAKDLFYPSLKRSDEEIGFIILDINKSKFKKELSVTKDNNYIFFVLVDDTNNIVINNSKYTDSDIKSWIDNTPKNYSVRKDNLNYSNCSIVSFIDTSILLHKLNLNFIRSLIVVILSIIVIILAIIFISSTISEQINDFICKLIHIPLLVTL